MGDHQHRTRVILEVVLEPLDAFGVEVVGWFVEQQDRRLLDQQARKRHAALLTAREIGHRPVARRAAQSFHRHFELVVECPAIDRVDLVLQFGHFGAERVEIGVFLAHLHADRIEALYHVGDFACAVLDVFEHGLALVEFGLLLEIADGDVLARPGFTGEIGVDARHDLDQRRLARPVGADDADLGTLVELQVDVAEHRLVRTGKGLGHVLHDESVLGGHRAKVLRMELELRARGPGSFAAQIVAPAPRGKRGHFRALAILPPSACDAKFARTGWTICPQVAIERRFRGNTYTNY